jgi:hypothetical protein
MGKPGGAIMATPEKSLEIERVSCEMCLKEIPKAAATSPEATDYFVYFCGLDCYEKWKGQGGKAPGQSKQPKRTD